MARSYDRKQLFERAEKARKRGRKRVAIARYRELLAVDRDQPEVHAKLAPLLARKRQPFDAWLSFRAAAEGFMRAQQGDRALAIYYEAAHHLPKQTEIWQTISRLQGARGKPEDALRALLDGRKRLRRRSERAHAIHLLRAAHELSPWTPAIVLDLARSLWRSRQRGEALLLLEALAQRVHGIALRQTRWLQLRISKRPGHLWQWLVVWKQTLGTPERKPRAARRAPAHS